MRESCKYGSVRGAGSNPRPLYVADCLANKHKTLGIEFPTGLLVRADEVIE